MAQDIEMTKFDPTTDNKEDVEIRVVDELRDARLELEISRNANAVSIIAECSRRARKFGCSREAIKELRDELTSGDYDKLVQTAMEYFDVS